MQNTVYLGLGSNLGNRFLNIKQAIFSLAEKSSVLEISSIDETDPVDIEDQPKFLNCALKVKTSLAPEELLKFTQGIEKDMGRVKTIDKGPRLIDIDILFYEDRIVDESGLRIPHPRLHERRFVLKSMAEISPDYNHPVLKKTMSELFRTA